jgi:mono/diheme cytochrome c family protein
MRPRLILALLLLFPMLLFPSVCLAQGQKDSGGPSRAVPKAFEGAKTFQYHCAACHGADGRGGGPAAAALKHAPPDLTLISQRNGGKFPFQRVKGIIDGKTDGSVAHGDREMPVWGPIFHEVESDQDWGEVRLDAATRHLESIQQK